jgi:hypothetical protein
MDRNEAEAAGRINQQRRKTMNEEEMDLEEIVTRCMNTSFIEKDNLQHTPVYAGWIAARLTRLALALNENVSDERIALVAETLMECEPAHLDWALTRAQREFARFPCPANVFELLREIPGFEKEELQ